jgi:hydrogenase 3 maturation protease
MPDLLRQFEAWRGRRLWLLGVGSLEHGDDGFGVRLAAALQARLRGTRAPVRVVNAGLCPERYVGLAARVGCQELVFADAADFGARPGALLLASAADLLSRGPAASTHRVPLSVLAQYAEALGLRAWLLGVQPGSLRSACGLSPPVAAAVESLAELLAVALFQIRDMPEVAP